MARREGLRIDKEDCVVLDFVDATTRHSLVTLASLFGMGPNTDLKGKNITEVMAQIAAAKARNPFLDITKITDASKISVYAEQIDLFKLSYPPEIIQISTFQWHKTRKHCYALGLPTREGIAVIKDLLDQWHIIGTVKGHEINEKHATFEAALREADRKVNILGGHAVTTLIQRKPTWSNKPSIKALAFAKRLGILVPPKATSREVAAKINAALQQKAENHRY